MNTILGLELHRYIWAPVVAVTLLAPIPTQAVGLIDTPEARYEALRAEWDAAVATYSQARRSLEKEGVRPEFMPRGPDAVDYARRFLELATDNPGTAGARDALIWVVARDYSRAGMVGQWAEQMGRAVDLLIESYADDVRVARVGLMLDRANTPARERLLRALHDRAQERSARGTAALALAQYLTSKATTAAELRDRDPSEPRSLPDVYFAQFRGVDPDRMLALGEQLFEEVLHNYHDVAYVRVPPYESNDLKRGLTLGDIATSRLDEIHHVSVGCAAPGIVGDDIDGKALTLGDYQGKVVMLVFWGTWCGPCMAEIPHEREMAKKYGNDAFAILGVNCDEDQEAARKVIRQEGITWPNWHDGAPGDGPIVKAYHVRSYPTTLVLDREGIIQYRGHGNVSAEEVVKKLLEKAAKP